MATIITRETGATAKGSPLTNQEVDNNFINLNTAKVEKDNAQYLDFDTAATNTAGVGKVYWNDADGTLEFGLKGGNVTLQVGQEQVVRIFNNTAGAFSDMQVIRITGASGQKLTASLAQADSEVNSASSLAVVTESISAAAEGFATTSGLVRNINTSAFSEGAPLYLSPSVAGGITATRPSAPNHTVLVGWCVRSHASAGVIYVNIMNGFELEELHDVKITSVANGQLLKWVTANSRWENTSDLDGLTSATITNNSANPALKITQTGTGNALVVEDVASDTTPFVIDQSGSVVVGNTSALNSGSGVADIGVHGDSNGAPIIGATVWHASATFEPRIELGKSRGTIGTQTAVLSGDGLGLIRFYGSDGASLVQAAQISASVDGTPALNDMPGRLSFHTTASGASSPTERMRITSAGKIGIANTSPQGMLSINGTVSEASPIAISISTVVAPSGTTQGIGMNVSPVVNPTGASLGNYYNLLSDFTANNSVLPASAYGVFSRIQLGAASTGFITNYYGFSAMTPVISGTGYIKNWIGFAVGNDVSTATDSTIGIQLALSAGAGKWNIYANGSANNYLLGKLFVGSTVTPASANVQIATSGSDGSFIQFWRTAATVGGAYIGTNGSDIEIGHATGTQGSETYTKRLNIDSSGNFVVGASTGAGQYRMQVSGAYHDLSYGITTGTTGTAVIDNTPPTNTTGYSAFGLIARGAAGAGSASIVSLNCIRETAGSSASTFVIQSRNSDGGYTEKLRVSPDGNLLINVQATQEAYGRTTLAIKATEGGLIELVDTDGKHSLVYRDRGTNTLTFDARDTNGGIRHYALGTGAHTFSVGGTEVMRVHSNGNVGIGTSSPGAKLEVVGTQSNFRRVSNDGSPWYAVALKSRGTQASQLTVNNGDGIVSYQGYAYDGTADRIAAAIAMNVDGVPANSTVPGMIGLWTTPSGTSQTAKERFRITSSGDAQLGVANNYAGSPRILGVYNASSTANTSARLDLSTGTANAYAIHAVIENGTEAFYQLSTGAGVTGGMYFTTAGNLIFRTQGRSLNTHAFSYNENGSQFELFDDAGVSATLIDQSLNHSRFLELVDGSSAVFGLGTGNATGSVKIMKAGYVEAITIDSSSNTTFSTRLKIKGLAGSTPSNAIGELIHNAGASIDYGLYLRHYNGTSYDAEVYLGGDASNGGSTIRFLTDASEKMRIQANGNVGIGVTSVQAKLDIGPADNANEGAEVKLRGATNATVDWNFDVYQSAFRLFTTDKGAGTNWQGRLSISHDSGIMVQMGSATFVGHSIRNNSASATVTGHSYVDFQNESGVATGSIINVHGTDGSSRIDFSATPAGARNSDRRAAVFQVYGNGNALAISPNGGLGYGTGAGGTVTQATSKSTAVTLNKPTGQITMHNAALAAGAEVLFLFNNSLITTIDVVIMNISWGAIDPSNYTVRVAPGAGVVRVNVKNVSAGSLSEAVVINFAIIKGAIA